jgi:hypothetical protein
VVSRRMKMETNTNEVKLSHIQTYLHGIKDVRMGALLEKKHDSGKSYFTRTLQITLAGGNSFDLDLFTDEPGGLDIRFSG